ncbi:MAG: Bax inhibitor-1/YccA family protein [Lautropia sp.]|nr:Bax inhibitor-1/YccA family protein [Lautropia sp.]
MAIDQISPQYQAAGGVEARNRVLRNTYALLSLSMIPTILGAWVGIATHFSLFASSPGLSFVAFLAIAWAFMAGITRFRNSGTGILLLLGFTFFMGLMLSRLLGFVLGMHNGPQVVMMAFGSTAIIFGVMASIASTSKRDFSAMGRWLSVGVIVILLAAVANIFLHLPALMLTISLLATVVFSLFILFDLNRVVTGGETNYVMATLSVYINLYNVFSNLLALFGVAGGNSSD